jgi:hypothetical protein
MSLAGKVFVFHRAIDGRKPEVLGVFPIPKNKKKMIDYYKYTFSALQDRFNNLTDLMPEVQDIMATLSDKSKNLARNERIRLLRREESYEPYIALYNPKTNKIESMYYDMPSEVIRELVGTDTNLRLEQLEELILGRCWLYKETDL